MRAAWLSLDEEDNDPARFLIYLVAALQTISANIGAGVLAVLQSPQPPSTESILTALLNEITAISHNFILILDDYHVIDSKPVDEALTFLLKPCRARCTWSSPPVRIPIGPWRGYAPGAN